MHCIPGFCGSGEIAGLFEMVEKRGAAEYNVGVGGVKIVRVPRVGNAAIETREGQERVDFSVRIVWENAPQVAAVVLVHENQPVVVVVIPRRDLPRAAPRKRNAVLPQNRLRRRVHVVAEFLPARRGRRDPEALRQSRLLHHVFENELRHWRPANISMADEKYSCHISKSSVKAS